MSEPRPPNRLPRLVRRVAVACALLLAGLSILFVSFDPVVAPPPRPTARHVAAARTVWQQLKAAKGVSTAQRIRADNEAIAGIVALASDATGYARFDARVGDGVLSGKASLALPAGLWVNMWASVEGEHAGFPAYSLKIGRVRLPSFASRWAADLVRLGLRLRGATVPPLDQVIRHVAVGQREVVADLVFPADSGVVDGIVSAGGQPLDEPLVSDIYCRIAAAQRSAPDANLTQQVRRTFDPDQVDQGEDFRRAAFVALAMLVVGDQANPLAPQAAIMTKNCPQPRRAFLLQQREDLAKHWAFSAGLTAVLGAETAASLGEWKELDDSLPNGTGFSFVDLAADRSGMQAALRALDPDLGDRSVAGLSVATDEDLLPAALLEGAEGMSDVSFIDRYGALDRERYRRAVAAIDRTLARQRLQRPGAD